MNFEDLVQIEPKLGDLLKKTKAVKYRHRNEKHFCALTVWEGFGCGGRMDNPPGEELDALVGWHRKDGPAEIKTREAYEIAFHKIYNSLPDCRGYCTDDDGTEDLCGPEVWPQFGAHIHDDSGKLVVGEKRDDLRYRRVRSLVRRKQR